ELSGHGRCRGSQALGRGGAGGDTGLRGHRPAEPLTTGTKAQILLSTSTARPRLRHTGEAWPMPLTPSAHVDTFCRDHLPPADPFPDLEFTLPELAYPDRLNCADALLTGTIDRLGADRPCLIPQGPDDPVWTYGDLARVANQIAHVLIDDIQIVPGSRVLL